MFYSHDLLGRKTPLGAIWTLAHGRKLSKGKIISINLRELCDEILQPGVPHSLRLQGILIGGLVIVFSKQQTYLLEDLQDMMRRVTAAGKVAAGGAADHTVKAEAAAKGKGKGKGKPSNQQARLEAITLMDVEDLLAPAAAYGDTDILGLLDTASLSEALASHGGSLGGRGACAHLQGGEIGDDMFVVPSTAPSPTSGPAATTTTSDGARPPGSKPSSRARTTITHQQQQEEEVYGGVDAQQQDWLPNPEDEMFDFHADLDLLGGMVGVDLEDHHHQQQQQHQPAGGSRQHTPTASHSTRTEDGSAAASGRAAAAGAAADGDAFMLDVDMMDDLEQQQQQLLLEEEGEALPADRAPAEASDADERQSDEQQGRDQRPAGDAGTPRGGKDAAAAVKQRKRRGGAVMFDDLDNLVIRSKMYREWSTNASPLINHQLKDGRPFLGGKASAATPLLDAGYLPNPSPFNAKAGFAPGPLATFGGGALSAGVPICRELLDLFKAPAAAAAAAAGGDGAGARKPAPQEPSSPEVNNSTGDGSLLGTGGAHVHRQPLDLRPVPAASEEDFMQQQQVGDELMVMMDESPHAPHEEQELQSNDEAHDTLGDLPFNGDIEVERMRNATTPGSSDGSLRNHLPGGSTGLRGKASVQQPDTTDNTSLGGSSLAGGRSHLGGSGLKRRLGSADLGAADNLGIFFGDGNLADLLPDIDLAADSEQQPDEEEEEEAADEGEARAAAAAAAGGAMGLAGSGPRLTPYTSSQFPLLEDTEPADTQADHADQLSNTTRVALSIFQERLQRAADAQPAAAAAADGSGGDAAAPPQQPSVSLFGLLKEGRLSRNQAATLFYQVCVTTTAGFITSSQERPYGDILIKPGVRAL